ncbi:spore germination protein [Clostridium sp. 'White wine YQ']|uniref:spore germination protein n=1 Tax=Clostridium sp. 'White wine YQ' TaxID=3027474 RepID=UPI002365DB35|nr:spore germination protein [Clostridium sp. 'White wine YQ']MDD7794820.1 spore germination protein [Clostridium sp. 'White wine YQ']
MDNIKVNDIKNRLANIYDIKYREIRNDKGNITLIYVDSLCDAKFISEYVIAPMMRHTLACNDIEKIKKEVIVATTVNDINSLDHAIDLILSAHAVIVFSYLNKAIYCEAKGFVKRAIDIPITETVIKGPREGFTENIQDNISAIRRRIKTQDLKIENMKIGKYSKTEIAMIYIQGSAPDNLINYVRGKINNIIEAYGENSVLSENNIEEELRCKGTAFDTIGYTEKPDIVSSKIMEGRVAILTDGTSFAITAPYFFIENFQTTDDYTLNKFSANLGRILRWFSFLLATLIPGLYLSLITYHFKMVPTIFLFRIAIFRAGVPVPTVVELVYMIVFFQIIREAGVRLPQPIGPTLSIVGALILGDAAVNSGLASQVTVVVVAITAIASYLIPSMQAGVFMWNLVIIGFSSLLGLPGFYMGVTVFISHLASLTSCGYPYLYPLGTLKRLKYKDVIFRGDLKNISSDILPREEKS